MSPCNTLEQARKLWRKYQQELKDAAYWESEGYEVDGFRLGGFLVADDIMERANRTKAAYDRIMSARSQRRKRLCH